jgi:putative exporter of polyketide antibiotics
MIAVTGYPVMAPASRWLLVSIVLYLAAILYTVLVTWRVQREIAAVGARLAAERVASSASPSASGPPPELAALIHRVRRDGKAMGIVIVVIVFLMVVKPPFPI